MGTIRRPLDYGSVVTVTTDFILFTNGQDPPINKLWCQDLAGIYREVHPKACVEILAGSVRQFVTEYLAENGRQIQIIGELCINGNVQFLGLSDQAWRSGLWYTANILAMVEATGWGRFNDSNQIQGVCFNDDNSITNVLSGASIDAHPDYLPWSSVSPFAAQRCV